MRNGNLRSSNTILAMARQAAHRTYRYPSLLCNFPSARFVSSTCFWEFLSGPPSIYRRSVPLSFPTGFATPLWLQCFAQSWPRREESTDRRPWAFRTYMVTAASNISSSDSLLYGSARPPLGVPPQNLCHLNVCKLRPVKCCGESQRVSAVRSPSQWHEIRGFFGRGISMSILQRFPGAAGMDEVLAI